MTDEVSGGVVMVAVPLPFSVMVWLAPPLMLYVMVLLAPPLKEMVVLWPPQSAMVPEMFADGPGTIVIVMALLVMVEPRR